MANARRLSVYPSPWIAGNPVNVPHSAGVGPLYKNLRFAGIAGEKSGAPVGCLQASVFPIFRDGPGAPCAPIKSAATGRDPMLVRQRIGFYTVTCQDDRVSRDPPLKMLMRRAVLVICLVIQSDPNRAIGPAISNQW